MLIITRVASNIWAQGVSIIPITLRSDWLYSMSLRVIGVIKSNAAKWPFEEIEKFEKNANSHLKYVKNTKFSNDWWFKSHFRQKWLFLEFDKFRSENFFSDWYYSYDSQKIFLGDSSNSHTGFRCYRQLPRTKVTFLIFTPDFQQNTNSSAPVTSYLTPNIVEEKYLTLWDRLAEVPRCRCPGPGWQR